METILNQSTLSFNVFSVYAKVECDKKYCYCFVGVLYRSEPGANTLLEGVNIVEDVLL